jgi:hypothetical protein
MCLAQAEWMVHKVERKKCIVHCVKKKRGMAYCVKKKECMVHDNEKITFFLTST